MKTDAEYLAEFTGAHVYVVAMTAILGDVVRHAVVNGIRADRPGQAETRALLIATNPGGAFRNLPGALVEYTTKELS